MVWHSLGDVNCCMEQRDAFLGRENDLAEMDNGMTMVNQSHSGIELDRIELPDIPELRMDPVTVSEGKSASLVGQDDEVRLSNILDDLDKQMKSGNFLHTFTAQIEEINRMIRMKYASTKDIASVILKDPALSAKVLSIVNSSYYGHFSEKGIASISEAMVILGTEEVQQAASTLLLFEFMQDISKSEQLKEKSLASLMRGMMAKEVAEKRCYPEKDEFQLVAMLYDIGEQIILFCDPDAYHRIRHFSESRKIGVEKASRKLLGASFGQIGQGIVTKWGFPPQVVGAIRPFKAFKKSSGQLSSQDKKRLVASFSNAMCNIDWRKGERHRLHCIEKIVRLYGLHLDLGMAKAEELLAGAMDRIENHANVLKIKLKESRFDRDGDGRVLPAPNKKRGAVDSTQKLDGEATQEVPSEPVTHGPIVPTIRAEDSPAKGENAMVWVARRLNEIEKSLASSYKLSDVLRAIMTTMYNGFFFSRIAICIIDRSSSTLAVRFTLCDDVDYFSSRFRLKVAEDAWDIFNKSLNTGMDRLIENINDKQVAKEVPEWYLESGLACSFAIFPLVIRKKKVGMIYVDWKTENNALFTNEVKQCMQQLKVMTRIAIQKSRG